MLKGGMRGWKKAGLDTTVDQNVVKENKGLLLYATQCATCHQSDGMGLTTNFPPLKDDPAVNTADPTALTGIILAGGSGRPIGGKSYSGQMPAFAGQLTDVEIATIETYVRSRWGNHADAVSPEQVHQLRAVPSGAPAGKAKATSNGHPKH